jgi:protein ImuB
MRARALHGLVPAPHPPSAPSPRLAGRGQGEGLPKADEAHELWVGVHLPLLAIEAMPVESSAPLAVVEPQGQTQYVVAACEKAQLGGVKPQMSMAAALSLVPTLETRSRNTQREQELLEQLAMRAQRFTPRVSLVPPDGLLLEVKGSLHLFGGVEGLFHALQTECRAAGASVMLALAPASLAALAGARAGKSLKITDKSQLIGQVSSLPLITLRWPQETIERLEKMGVYSIGQALRLPRAGFARRFGTAYLASLDRLRGRDPGPSTRFRARERFRRRLDLLYELENHDVLLEVLLPLLQELGAFLQKRQCGITRLDCLLHHRSVQVTRCSLRLAAPGSDVQHLGKLLAERLATVPLPEPVRACELRTSLLVRHKLASKSLWQPGEYGGAAGSESSELVEHLRARLGHEAVYGMQIISGHRPETSWRLCEPGVISASASPPWPAFRRPIWLLSAPEPLSHSEGLPSYHGPLRLLSEPERVETGWWDGAEITRDYYKAVDVRGVRLWIYRERKAPHPWFLHGVFG